MRPNRLRPGSIADARAVFASGRGALTRQDPRPASPRPVTIRDVARAAGVSVASASRALNGLDNVTPHLRERVLGAAQQLRYFPHTAARALSTRRTDTLGVVLPDLHGEFFSEVIRGADLAARARGLHLLVSTSHGDKDEAAAAIRSMRGRVDGLILMSPYVDEDLLADNLADDQPIVLINSRIGGRRNAAFCVDNHAGAMAAVKHLAAGGRRVAHIAGPADNFESEERRRGYRDALGGVEDLILEGDFSEESGYRAGLRLAGITEAPRAVFAANDMMAIGCLLALGERGVRVPADVALAGFDDVPVARLIRPSLTTVRTDIADLSRRAMERLVAMIAGEDIADQFVETTRPTLVVRESSAGISNAAGSAAKKQTGRRP
jgi:LacI family transcriptional regulator